MNVARVLKTSALAVAMTCGAGFLTGCADGGGYYGPDVDVGVGFGYYDSPGYYGGWGRGYRVGPWRGDHRGDDHRGYSGHSTTHSYRAAPAGRSAPSIPSRGHSGGGGGHGGPHH